MSNLGYLVGEDLNSLQMGDYVLIDPFNTNGGAHGLYVTGWGPIENCQDSLSTRRIVNSFSINHINNTVPYVVDFTGGAMSPTPRPFYCSIYNDQIAPGVGYFNRHDWYFYRIINEYSGNITISLSQLYVHPDWQWSATSGQ